MFVVIAAVLVIAVVLFIAWPLFRNSTKPLPAGIYPAGGEEDVDLEAEKQNILASLTDLESDLQGGKLTQSDYERLKDIDEHRLAGILDKIDNAATADEISAGIQARGDSPEPLPRFRAMNIAGFILTDRTSQGFCNIPRPCIKRGFVPHLRRKSACMSE